MTILLILLFKTHELLDVLQYSSFKSKVKEYLFKISLKNSAAYECEALAINK